MAYMESLGNKAMGEGTLPQDSEDQMQLGIRIITTAFQSKMQSLEQEIRGLRLTSEEQREKISTVQKKNSTLEVELVESHQRSQQLAEENKELFKTVGSLRKQIQRLEHLKAAVLSSIQDDQAHDVESGDTRAFMSDEYLRGATPLTHAEMGMASSQPRPISTLSSTMQTQEMPMTTSTASAYKPGTSPPYDSLGSSGGLAASGGSPVIDGKQFFRQARSKLSYEAFNSFLASIKRLNNQQQTREATLEESRRIFGAENQELYKDFELLLNRHGM